MSLGVIKGKISLVFKNMMRIFSHDVVTSVEALLCNYRCKATGKGHWQAYGTKRCQRWSQKV